MNIESMKEMKDPFRKGMTFSEFLSGTRNSKHPWQDFYDRARVPGEILYRAESVPGQWRFLVLCEEWCGDGANILPYLARVTEAVPDLDLRVLPRDENPALMDAHLTNGTKSIPVVMILDQAFREVGWWGPRPAPLQELFVREIRPLPQDERYPKVRAWYARDRGRTTLQEIVGLLESVA